MAAQSYRRLLPKPGEGREPWQEGEGGEDRGKCVLPLHPLLVSAVLKHTLWGHVNHQRHGGIGMALVPGQKGGGAQLGSEPSQTGTVQPGQGTARPALGACSDPGLHTQARLCPGCSHSV